MTSHENDLLCYRGSSFFYAVWCFCTEKNFFHKMGVVFCLSVFLFIFARHEYVSKGSTHFRTHSCSIGLEIIGTSFLVENGQISVTL